MERQFVKLAKMGKANVSGLGGSAFTSRRPCTRKKKANNKTISHDKIEKLLPGGEFHRISYKLYLATKWVALVTLNMCGWDNMSLVS